MKAVGNIIKYLAAVLTLISTVFYVLNVNQPYYQDMNQSILMLLVLAVALSCLPLLVKKENQTMVLVNDICRIAVPILVLYSAVRFLAMRIESFGYIFASNLEAGNEAAMTAATQAVLVLGLLVAAWVASVVVAFLKNEAKVS